MCSLIEVKAMHGMLKHEYNLIIHIDISAHETSHFQMIIKNCADFTFRLSIPGLKPRAIYINGIQPFPLPHLYKIRCYSECNDESEKRHYVIDKQYYMNIILTTMGFSPTKEFYSAPLKVSVFVRD